MAGNSLILILVALLLGVVLLSPRLANWPFWRATVTPLASIIGSGFLVAGPILAHAAGRHAWLAMLGLCAVAYLFGGALRHNIRHVEPLLTGNHRGDATTTVRSLERASELALSLAYFVSVAYYLNLFAAFGLRIDGIVDPFWIRVAATITIAAVGTVGALGGLTGLERVEIGAVGLKLSLIGGLIAALTATTAAALAGGSFDWPELPHAYGAHELSILLGLVILVQGFETSRYLGSKYDTELRVRSMRWAQGIATVIYLIFILLITPYFTGRLPEHGGETAIIDMLRPVSLAVAPAVIIAALASQLSAAVADMNGASGLLTEVFGQRLKVNLGNIVTALVAIAITWSADIYEIIAYASKAFVAYYALQSAQAFLSTRRQRDFPQAAQYLAAVVIAVAIILFGKPIEV